MKATGTFRPLYGFGIALFLLVAAGIALFSWFGQPPGLVPEGGLFFTLEAGESASSAALRLENEGALRSSLVFRVLARIRGLEGSLKTGTYIIQASMGATAILDLLASGRQLLERVTIPEGSTLSGTARTMESSGVCHATDVLEAARDHRLIISLGIVGADLEGFLFPDTYFLPRAFPAEDVLRTMVKNFRIHIAEIEGGAGLPPRQLADRVILASIVEREYRVPEEAPLIAGVFENRLRIGMALQSCATVAYVITERLGKPHPEVIFDRDLGLADPYNTYAHAGLPPGPICSPGMTALRAALAPPASSWLYFRLIDEVSGRHHFSATLDQHLKADTLTVKRTSGE